MSDTKTPIPTGKPEAASDATDPKAAAPSMVDQVKANLDVVAISFIGMLLVYVIGAYGYSFAWILVIGLPIMLSVENVIMKRRARQQTQMLYSKFFYAHFPESESAEWINTLIWHVWENYSLYISDEVIKTVTESLKDAEIPGVKKLEMTKFILGNTPPTMSNFKVNRDDPKKYILALDIDWKSQLQVGIKATTSVGLPIPLKVWDLHFTSTNLNVELAIKDSFPFVSKVSVQMVEQPYINVQIKPIGVPLTACPGLDIAIRKMIISGVAGTFCPPNRLEIDLEETLGDDPTKMGEKLKEAKEKKSLMSKTTGGVTNVVGGVGSAGKAVVGGGVDAAKNLGKAGMGAVTGLGSAVAGLGGLRKRNSGISGDKQQSEKEKAEKEEKRSSGMFSMFSPKKKKSQDSVAEGSSV